MAGYDSFFKSLVGRTFTNFYLNLYYQEYVNFEGLSNRYGTIYVTDISYIYFH